MFGDSEAKLQRSTRALQRQPVGTATFFPMLLLWARVDSPFAMSRDPTGVPMWPRGPRPGPVRLAVASPFLMCLILMELHS